MLNKSLVLSAAMMLSGCVVYIDSNSGAKVTQELQESLRVDVIDAKKLVVDINAGDIEIVGDANINYVSIDATIYTTDEKNYALELVSKGDKIALSADAHTGSSMTWYSGNSPRIDMKVSVPAGLNIELDDSSGDIIIRGMTANIDIEDGSGNLDIEGGHHIYIDDGSGNITLKSSTGNLSVEDGSGELVISNVNGNVSIEDGSGGISIDDITGVVTIDDGSGDIDVTHAGGLIITDDGSGSVRSKHIKGDVQLNN